MGKPPTELSIDPLHAVSVGVHLCGREAHVVSIDALGSVVAEKTFAPDRLTDGFSELLPTNDAFDDPTLTGIGVTAEDEEEARQRASLLAQALGHPAVPASPLTASVWAERYFGGAQQTERFLYFDAKRLELAAMVGAIPLAGTGTFRALCCSADRSPGSGDILKTLGGAAALLQAQAVYVSGMAEGSAHFLSDDLPLRPASEWARRPALAAATFPLAGALSLR